MFGFVCGKHRCRSAVKAEQAEKICRVHKNQAVNLLQIAIHDQNDHFFLLPGAVKIFRIRSPVEFAGSSGYSWKKDHVSGIAAKFLQ
jgi:hypothetical protein